MTIEIDARAFDVPLNSAMLYWLDDGSKAIVIPLPENYQRPIDGMMLSTGACFTGYPQMSEPLQMLKILIDAWQAVVCGAAPGEIHRALCQIPEFRQQFADDVPKPMTNAAHIQAAYQES